MNDGSLPAPQGLLGLLGGLVPTLSVNQETLGNEDFEALLAEVLEAGDLSPDEQAALALLQVQAPMIAAMDGKPLPPESDTAPDEAQIEALVAMLLGMQNAPIEMPSRPPVPGESPDTLAAAPVVLPAGTARNPEAARTVSLVVDSVPADRSAAAEGDETGARLPLPGLSPEAARPPQPAEGALRVPAPRSEAAAAIDQAPARTPDQAVAAMASRAPEGQVQTPSAAPIQTPVNRPEWGGELSQRVYWMATGGRMQHAEIKLNPPHLGPLEVKVVIRNDEASVFFSSHHALTRDAVEQALPRLREMFGENGINLGQVTVSGGDTSAGGETREQATGDHPGMSFVADNAPLDEPVRASWQPQRSPLALIDTYV